MQKERGLLLQRETASWSGFSKGILTFFINGSKRYRILSKLYFKNSLFTPFSLCENELARTQETE